jgi:hypothetical protein
VDANPNAEVKARAEICFTDISYNEPTFGKQH